MARGTGNDTDGLRAALLGVYSETQGGPGFPAALPAALRPIPISEAVDRITHSTSPYQRTAWYMTAHELALRVLGREGAVHRTDLVPYLISCVGAGEAQAIIDINTEGYPDNALLLNQVDHILGRPTPMVPLKVTKPPEGSAGRVVAQEKEAAPVDTPAPPAPPAPPTRPTPLAMGPLAWPPPGILPPGTPNIATGSFDPSSMVTTAFAANASPGNFTALSEAMDPQAWSRSPFWVDSYIVTLQNGRFRRLDNPPPLGSSWSGFLYEFVEWNMNDAVISGMQNYLNIDYQVNQSTYTIQLNFSLCACQGSMMLERISGAGIEVDSGWAGASPMNTTPSSLNGTAPFLVAALKRLRFADTLSRSTPNQGVLGEGQIINLLSPAVVSIWMDALVEASIEALVGP